MLNLPSIRKNRGVSLRQIEGATKIRMTYLEAIESEEFERLPGQIYSVSYIRQYARAIDYDESLILDSYHRQVGPAVPLEPADAPKDRTALGTLLKIWRFVRT